ncbi:hypothetical protein FCF10_04835 [Lactobacillus amylovorus subsp. animalium]|nr:hypothetical protein FCF10_04835 [Lactobacillus amylovorus]
MEFVDHLSLEKYLSDSSVQKQFNDEAKKTSLKFAFRKQDRVDDMEEFILSGINELTPLYEKL